MPRKPSPEHDVMGEVLGFDDAWESLSRYQVAAIAVEALAELERRVAEEKRSAQIRSMLGYAKARAVERRNWWD